MPRIPLLHEDDPNTPPEVRALLAGIGEKRGLVANVYRALANPTRRWRGPWSTSTRPRGAGV